MTYHQQALVYTSDNSGKGKATYWEDNNGKITKKTKTFSSPDEMQDISKKMGFHDSTIDSEEFMNFSIPSPFRVLGNLVDNFFGRSPLLASANVPDDTLPKGVNMQKHRQRMRDIQEKKRRQEQAQQEREEKRIYLKGQIEELKTIKKELKNNDDHEGAEEVEEDIQKIEQAIKELK